MDQSSNLSELRDQLIQLLNRQLADTVDLRLQTREAYFNVKGNRAPELRRLFNGLARDLQKITDLIAQQIVSIGGQAVTTARRVADKSGLRDYPDDAFEAQEHLQALLSSYSRYELDTRRNTKEATQLNDSETVELLDFLSAAIERNLWFLEVYLEGIAIGLHGSKLPVWKSPFDSRVDSQEGLGRGTAA